MRSPRLSLALAVVALAPATAQEPAPARPAEPWIKDPRKLTDDSRAGEAYFSPDGKRILFQAIRPEHPHYQIYVMDADGANRRLVSTGKGKTTCAFFDPRDPTRFIYASTHLDPRTHAPDPPERGARYRWDYDEAFDIFVASLDTGEVLARLTDAPGYDAECAFSPDGARVVFTSTRGGGDPDIWHMNADGSDQRPLVQAKGQDGGPFFAPDGRTVLYRASREREDVMHAYLLRAGEPAPVQLTRAPRVNWAPYFHPGGRHVVYAANVGGHRTFQLFLVLADGSGREVQLTHDPGFDGLPTFSPDGKRLLWTSTRHGGAPQVYVANFVMPPDDAFRVPDTTAAPPAQRPGGERRPAQGEGGERGARPTQGGEQGAHGGQGGHGQGAPAGGAHGAGAHGAGAPAGGAHGQGMPTAPSAPGPHGERATGLLAPRAGVAAAPVPGLDRIRRDDLRADVAWLADDGRDGRRAGSPAEREAAEWLARRLGELGARPGGTDGAWLEPFEFPAGARLAPAGNALVLAGQPVALDAGWTPLLYSGSGVVEGELVFCGHGVVAPEHGWDDFAGLDLAGKVALVLTGGPRAEDGGAFGAKHPTVWEDVRFKVSSARERGAKAVLLVRGAGPDDAWLRLGGGDPGLLVGHLRREALAPLGVDVAALARAASGAHGAGPASRPLGLAARVEVAVERVRGASQNVVGRFTGAERPEEVIVVGAHYDHLGRGGDGSLAPGSQDVHNGADDNASGTAALLALARALKAAPPRRTVLLVAFGAEEAGLLGSAAFVARPPVRRERIVAMLNMDMIGRLGDQPLLVGGAGTAAEWPGLLQDLADQTGRPVATQQDGQGPSDHASFYGAGVPVLFLWTGTHEDYHKPSDDLERLDLAGLERCAQAAWRLVRGIDALPARPTFRKVAQAEQPRRVVTGERGAYFGSIPNYAQDGVAGVLLDGARPGTPADRAGVRKGDVLVEFAGQEVRTIHEYVNALRLARPGQTVRVVVVRDGARVTLEATLDGR